MNQDINTLTQSATDILRALVGFDSTSRLSNLPIIEYIKNYLEKYHIHCVMVPSPDGEKSNLLARIGPEVEGGIILSGHTDVVPVEGQKWDSEPFTLTEKNGKLFGRGTSDMKSFIAVCLALAPDLAKLPLEKPIYLAFSYDEEVGCLGVPHLLSYASKHIPKPAFAIIGEPTEMKVVTSHKGMLSFETTVHGLEWHSSQPHYGVNAVHVACDLVNFLSGMAAELTAGAMHDGRFDPPYSTVHVGVIQGGTARNIIPRECKFLWEIRPLPGEKHKLLIDRFEAHCKEHMKAMKKKHAEAGIVTKAITNVSAVTLPADAEAIAQKIMRAALTNEQHAVSFFTEGGVFQEHHIPAIICGPGSIKQAHQPNEFIEMAQIRACVEFLMRLTENLSLRGA